MALMQPPEDPRHIRAKYNSSKHDITKARLERAELEEYQRSVQCRVQTGREKFHTRKDAERQMAKEDHANWKANRRRFDAARAHEHNVEEEQRQKRADQAQQANAHVCQTTRNGLRDFEENLKRLGIDEEGGGQAQDKREVKLDDADYIDRIRQRKQEEVLARKERGKRKQKMILDQQKVQRMIQEDQHRDQLLERIVKRTKDERRLAQDIETHSQRKALETRRRAMEQKDQQLATQRKKEALALAAADQRERDRIARSLAIAEQVVATQAVLDQQQAAKAERRNRMCCEIAYQIVELASKVVEYRAEVDASGTGILGQRPMVPARTFRLWMEQLVTGEDGVRPPPSSTGQMGATSTSGPRSPRGSSRAPSTAPPQPATAGDEGTAQGSAEPEQQHGLELPTPDALDDADLHQYLHREGEWAQPTRPVAHGRLWNSHLRQWLQDCEHAVAAPPPRQPLRRLQPAAHRKAPEDARQSVMAPPSLEYQVGELGAGQPFALALFLGKPHSGCAPAATAVASRLNMGLATPKGLVDAALAALRRQELGSAEKYGRDVLEALSQERCAIATRIRTENLATDPPDDVVAALAANQFFWLRAVADAAGEPQQEAVSPPKGKGAPPPQVSQPLPAPGRGLLLSGWPQTARQLSLLRRLVASGGDPVPAMDPSDEEAPPAADPLLLGPAEAPAPQQKTPGAVVPAASLLQLPEPPAAPTQALTPEEQALLDAPEGDDVPIDVAVIFECPDAVALSRYFAACPQSAGSWGSALDALADCRRGSRELGAHLESCTVVVRCASGDASSASAVADEAAQHVIAALERRDRVHAAVRQREELRARVAQQGMEGSAVQQPPASLEPAGDPGDGGEQEDHQQRDEAREALAAWGALTQDYRLGMAAALRELRALRRDGVAHFVETAQDFRQFLASEDGQQRLAAKYKDAHDMHYAGAEHAVPFQPQKAAQELQAALWAEVDARRDSAQQRILDSEGADSAAGRDPRWPAHGFFASYKEDVQEHFKHLLELQVRRFERSAALAGGCADPGPEEDAPQPVPERDRADAFLAAFREVRATRAVPGDSPICQRERELLGMRLDALLTRYYAFREQVCDEARLVCSKMRLWLSAHYRRQMAAVSDFMAEVRAAQAACRAVDPAALNVVCGPYLPKDDSSLLAPLPPEDLRDVRPLYGGRQALWITRDQTVQLVAKLRAVSAPDGIAPVAEVRRVLLSTAATSFGTEDLPEVLATASESAVTAALADYDWAGKGVVDWRLLCLSMLLSSARSCNQFWQSGLSAAQLQDLRRRLTKKLGPGEEEVGLERFMGARFWFEEGSHRLHSAALVYQLKELLWHIFCESSPQQQGAVLRWRSLLAYLAVDEIPSRAAEKCWKVLSDGKDAEEGRLTAEEVRRCFHFTPYAAHGAEQANNWSEEAVACLFSSIYGELGGKPAGSVGAGASISFAQLCNSHVGKWLLAQAEQFRRREFALAPSQPPADAEAPETMPVLTVS